jgi:hypothetical protein
VHRAIAITSVGLVLVAVAGLVVRHKLSLWVCFSAYLAAVGGFGVLIAARPDLYSPEVWMVKQGIYDSLLLGMSVELAYRVFSLYRGIAARMRLVVSLMVIATTVVVGLLLPRPEYAVIWKHQPTVTVCGIWILTATSLAIVRFQIPIAPFVSASLVGLVPYLLVFTICEDLLGRLGWGAIGGLNIANAIAYTCASAYWAYAAWRRD